MRPGPPDDALMHELADETVGGHRLVDAANGVEAGGAMPAKPAADPKARILAALHCSATSGALVPDTGDDEDKR